MGWHLVGESGPEVVKFHVQHYVRFIDRSDFFEGPITFWLPVEGNEHALHELDNAIAEEDLDDLYELDLKTLRKLPLEGRVVSGKLMPDHELILQNGLRFELSYGGIEDMFQ